MFLKPIKKPIKKLYPKIKNLYMDKSTQQHRQLKFDARFYQCRLTLISVQFLQLEKDEELVLNSV